VEPTPAGYHAARRVFAAELANVERLGRLLDEHLDSTAGVDADGAPR